MAEEVYHPEENTYLFARDVRAIVKKPEKTSINVEATEYLLWRRLLDVQKENESARQKILNEAGELKNLMGSIYQNRLRSTKEAMKAKRNVWPLSSRKK